jgi:hypothetical protein
VTLGQTGAIFNDPDSAMLFDGSTGFIALSGGPSTNNFTALTVECWVKFASLPTSTNPRLIANSHADFDNDAGFEVAVAGTSSGGFPNGSAGTIGISLGTGSTHGNLSSTTQISTGTWYHMVFTWDGSTIRYYQNGLLQTSTSFSGTLGTTSQIINIARNPVYAGDYAAATIDEVALYNYVLSAGRIQTHYNVGTLGHP